MKLKEKEQTKYYIKNYKIQDIILNADPGPQEQLI